MIRKKHEMNQEIIFVSGIDTGIGKTASTGYLAALLHREGVKVTTSKPVETGMHGISEDLSTHNRLAPFLKEDSAAQPYRNSYLFTYPASPHLAAEMDGKCIDLERLRSDVAHLLAMGYEKVLMEGAGGLMVPLRKNLLTIDFVAQSGYGMAFVTCGRLGSLNHTLLSLEAMDRRGIPLRYLLYNAYPHEEKPIDDESRAYLKELLATRYPDARWVDVPLLAEATPR